MLILVIDTSTRNGTTGWLEVAETDGMPIVLDYAHTYMPAIPGHAERLIERVNACLTSGGFSPENVDLIVVGQGPGTFTGLRIGFSTAKSLAIVHKIPLMTVSTLEMLACNARIPGPVLSLIDARRKEVYAGIFNLTVDAGYPKATRIGKEQVMKPESVASLLTANQIAAPLQIVGDGGFRYAETLAQVGTPLPGSAELHTWVMGVHGYLRFKQNGPVSTAGAEPEYLREPDAKKPKTQFGTN